MKRKELIKKMEERKKMSLEDAKAEITNRVYFASLFFEKLEDAEKIKGNGHHLA